ncbi:MAG: AlpA family phage regulatory protein [Acidobacteria bacterium]|nr:AlpA family phage regulatory protein [Acidobacteriota bacterium]
MSTAPLLGQAILRRRQVESATGYARSTIYNRISEGLWPRPVRLGPRAVGWPASEVAAIIAARIAGLSDGDIRALVVDLEAARASALASAHVPQRDPEPGEVCSGMA